MEDLLKDVPPVPIKTYQWEDIRREKKLGKYPYTYLYKGPYIEDYTMEEKKDNKPSDGEKKGRKVRKVKKKVGDATKKEEPSKEGENKKEVLMEVEQLVTEETEITEIKLKEQPQTPEPKLKEPEFISEKMEIDEISSDKTEEKLPAEDIPTDNLNITELRDISAERTTEGHDMETISPSDKLISTKEHEVIKTKDEHLDEQKDTTDKMSIDASIGIVSKSTESEDTYTESNIEQYLDKEEISKSVSDASCLEVTTSMSDVELPIDTKQTTLDVQTDKKRKHSDLSEVTKSNLSLFEKMKNTKFKAPTFKIPKFKKLNFSKKNSKRVKTEPSVQKTVAKVEIETTQRRKSESPLYIYIPLNPSAEELEQERLKLDSRRANQGSSEPTNGNGRFNETKDTNGTATVTTPTIVDIKSVSSKWKSLQSKTDKKSPPFKKKSGKNGKKTSPKSEKKSSPPVDKRRGDSPVEYIHIPLTGPLPPELIKDAVSSKEKEIDSEESISTPKVETKLPKSEELKSKSPAGSPKGAIKKKPAVKDKKNNESDYKLARNIKKLASKLKGIQKKNKKVLGSKKTSIKSSAKDEPKAPAKKTSPTSKKRGDSPVEYIHIPLTGPLPDNLLTTKSTSQKEEEPITLEKNQTLEKNEETELLNVSKNKKDLESNKDTKKEEEPTITNISEREELGTSTEKEEKSETKETFESKETKEEKKTSEEETKSNNEELETNNIPEKEKNVPKEVEEKNNPEEEKNSMETDSKENPEVHESTTPETPKTPTTPGRDIDAILRMTGSSLSIENQKFIKVDKEKESLLTRMKSLKKPDKKSIKKKDRKSSEKEEAKPPISPTKEHSQVVYPGMRHKDSIVEYIHIPLHLDQDQEKTEEMEVDDIKSSESEIVKETESPVTSNLTPDAQAKETKISTPESKKMAPALSPKENEEKQNPVPEKVGVFSKLKGLTHKAEKKQEKLEKPKTTKEPLDVKKKVLDSKIHEDSPPVEYIHIPLKGPIKEESKVDDSVIICKPTNNIIDEKIEKEAQERSESNKEIAKKSLLSKLKGVQEKPEKTPKKEEAKTELKKGDSPPVEYTFIPLNPSESEQTDEAVEKAKEVTEELVPESIPKSTEETAETISESMVVEEIPAANSEPIKTESQESNEETSNTNESVKTKPSATSKWRGLKVGLKADTRSPPTKKKPVKKVSPKSENKSDRRMPPIVAMRREDSIVEYIHIPLNPTEEELAAEKEKEDKLLENKKQTVISGSRTPIKNVSPKSEKKLETKTERSMPPVAVRREDSIVDYIHIPLNPSEEEIAAEKEKDKKVQESTKLSTISVARSPEPTKKSVETSKVAKDTSKGAIKKQPEDKSNPVKDTTSKLTEDIKKFALKLKEMKNKTKKPTFKTFKRNSILGSKKVSPPVAKKSMSSDPLRIRPRREDSPVDYIFIPLNPSPEQLKLEQEREKLRQISRKPTEEEIKKEKEKQRLRRISKTPAAPTTTTTTITKATTVTKKMKPEKPKKKVEAKSSTASSSSLNDTLKKTKELSKAKLQAIKDTVQQTRDKMTEKKVVKAEEKKVEKPIEKKIDVTTKRESPDYIFIPLKISETDAKHEEKETVSDETMKVTHVTEQEKVTEEKIPSENVQKESEIKVVPEVEKIEEKVLPESEKVTEEEIHHYEPISKEDEEDGLKTAVLISKEAKQAAEEQALKSVLKAADSPKMQKKVSFKRKSASIDKEHGLETNQSVDDDNIIYETIQIGEPEKEKPDKPSRKKDAKPKLVDEPKSKSDRDDDQAKWSNSTDHEYEPINPPSEPEAVALKASTPAPEAPPSVHVTQLTDLSDEESAPTAPPNQEPAAELRQLRIPLDDELIIASAETPEPDSTADRTSSLQATPTPTLSSRTDGISTSQVDSATLEHLPLKKEGRKQKLAEMEQADSQGPNIQERFRTQAGKLKSKIKSIKKPTFTIPNPKFSPKFKTPKFERPKFQRPKFDRPKFQRPKFETPKFSMPSMPSMPKMPDRPKINFPSFSLPRPGKRSADDRHISTTESSADSRKNIFDFRTYPRLFDRSKKKQAAASSEEPAPAAEPEFATVPRAAARKKGPIGSRWVHRFTDIQFADEEVKKPASYSDELHSKDRGDSLERRMEADLRYEQALAEAEADEEMREYEKENQNISRHSPYHPENPENVEYTERWRHGSFHNRERKNGSENEEIPLDRTRDRMPMEYDMRQSSRDEHSSVASSGHRGVIEEIDSDQFFLREKGISQDNLQVGLYLSSEIRDAFRQPVNALSQMEREYDLDASDISLARPRRPKRKHLKKTKRVKKTPHASHEMIPFDQESVNTEPEEYNPDYNTFPMPKPRRTKRSKMLAKDESLDTSQGEMPIDDEVNLNVENLKSQEDLATEVSCESIPNIIGYVEKDLDISEEYDKYLNDDSLMYENEIMQNIEQPEIIIHADQKYEIEPKDIDKYLEHTGMVQTPKPPTRRQKSLKSLNLSEHDSILGEFNRDKMVQDILEQELNVYRVEHEYIVPEHGERPMAPQRTRSRSRTESQADDDRTSHGAESFITESEEVCEAPCRRDMRDAMGYAIIDKSQKYREPPLPSTPRRRRSTKSNRSDRSPVDAKFFTVPRALNDAPPTRPTRNYSTLGPNRPPRRKSELDLTAEEKENIDISQYIEIEDDEHNRDLQSGDVINKMKGRPLPAPPRPPRKTRDRSKEALRDITQQSNIISDTISEHEKILDVSPASPVEAVEEIEVSTQTDPLPDDFCCEEFVQEPTDRVVAPTRRKRSIQRDSSIQSLERPKTPLGRDSSIPRTHERPKTPLERASSPNAMVIERRVHTPVEDETVTHASLLVRPVPEYPPDSFVSKRFGADIPDVLQEKIISSSRLSHSEPEEMSPEPEFEENITLPISETLSSDTITLLPQTASEEFFSTRTDISDILTETSQATPVPFESEHFGVDITEQVPEIPEKPQRKSQAQITPTQRAETTPQPQIIERIIERQVPVCVTPGPDTEVEILRAHRLQVSELDVEKLNVNELQASKILVSEIDGVSLQISELTTKSGNLVVNGMEIPSGLIQEILDRLQPASQPPPQPSSSTEQVATQTSIEEPEPNTKEFTEPATEQVATQTSIEIPDEQIHIKPPSTEQVSTQTSVEEPEDSIIPEDFKQLRTVPVVLTDPSEQYKHMEESMESEEFEELSSMPGMQTEHLEHAGDSIAPQELVRLLTSSPTIVVDPPEPTEDDHEPEQDEPDKEIDEEKDEEQDAIKHIRERIRFIEEEMSEFISDFTPDEMSEIKSEIESIIDIASERVRTSQENISEEENILHPHSGITTEDIIFYRENIGEPEEPYEQDDILDFLPELETDMFLPQQIILPDQNTNVILEEYIEPTSSPSVTLTELPEVPEILKPVTLTKFNIPETQAKTKTPETQTKTKTPETQAEIKSPEIQIHKKFDVQKVEPHKSDTQTTEIGDSNVPKEFYELKSEQAEIIDNIQKQIKVTATPKISTETTDKKTDKPVEKEIHKEQLESSQPLTPPRPPLPDQERISEHVQSGQLFRELHYPMSYYPDYVTSMPPREFYTLRSHAQELSDEDVHVHHRRRRHHRHLSRSRSSSDDERRTVSRRHVARSPEPSIPQLTGQLTRACSNSVIRAIRQLATCLGNRLGTREGKQDLQIAVIILLVLIAGLILLGFGSGKTVHLHHWEYFNPPKEL